MSNEPVAWMNRLGRLEYEQGNGFEIPLYTHPAKELHLSLQKVKDTGELLAVTYTDDEHRIVEVLWQKPPAKTLTDDVVNELWAESQEDGIAMQQGFTTQQHYFAHLILRKAQDHVK
jgi:hypothetical protein